MCRKCCCGLLFREGKRGQGRLFLTKTEKAEKLKSYTEELKKELAAVEEHIKELSS